MQNVKYITIIYQLHSFNSMRYFLQSVETMPINNIFSGLTITFPLQSGASFFFPMASWIWSKHLSWVWIFPNEINTCHDFEFWGKSMAGGHRKVIFHEKSSAKSGNVMVSPKNFTVGSPVTSDQALLQIFGHGNVLKTASLYQSDLRAILNTFPWPKIWSSAWSEITVDPTKNHFLHQLVNGRIGKKPTKVLGIRR